MAEATNRGKWSKPGVPHKGWSCIDMDDLEEPSAICEMCESTEIRYVHHMEHPEYPEVLGVGCICAGHMQQDVASAKSRETSFKAISKHKANWLKRAWKLSRSGNPYLKAFGYHVVVFRAGSGWGSRITNTRTDASFPSKLPYATEDAAKLGAFKGIQWLKSQGK